MNKLSFFLLCIGFLSNIYSEQQCSIGCQLCEQIGSSLVCLKCELGFDFDQQVCVYQQCENDQYFQKRSSELQSNCVSICDTNYLPNKNTNTCNYINQCSQSYSSQTILSNNSLIRDIIPYSQDYYIIIYDGFCNIILRQNGEYLLTFNMNSTIQQLIFHRQILIAIMNDNSIQILELENKSMDFIALILKGSLSDKSYLFEVDLITSCITSIDSIKKVVYFNLIAVPFTQQILDNSLSMSLASSRFIIVNDIIGYQTEIKIQLFRIIKIGLAYQFKEITEGVISQLPSNSIIQNLFFNKYNQDQFIVLLKDSFSFISINITLRQTTVQMQACIIQDMIIFKDAQKRLNYLLQHEQQLSILDNNFVIIQTISLSGSNILSILLLQIKSTVPQYLLLVLNNQNKIFCFVYESNFQTIDHSGLIVKITKPQNLKAVSKDTENNEYAIFVTGFDFQELIYDNQSLQVKWILQSFSQTYNSNQSLISKIIYDSTRQRLYSCSSEGKIVSWNVKSAFQVDYLTDFTFFNDSCRDSLLLKSRILVVILTSSIQVIDVLFPNDKYYIQKPDKSKINLFSSDRNDQYIIVLFDGCILIISDLAKEKIYDCSSSLASIKKIYLTSNNRIFTCGSTEIREYKINYIENTLERINQYQNFNFQLYFFKIIEELEIVLILFYDSFSKLFIVLDSDFQILHQNVIINVNVMLDVVTNLEKSGLYRFFFLFQTSILTEPSKIYIETVLQGESSSVYIKNLIRGFLIYQVQTRINYLGELVYFIFSFSPLSYTSLTLVIKWNSITQLEGTVETYDFSRDENMTTIYLSKENQISYIGNTSGFLGAANVITDSSEKVYQTDDSDPNYIICVEQSYELGRYFIVKQQILEFDLYLNKQIGQIDFQVENIESITGLKVINELRLIICYKSSEMIIKIYPPLQDSETFRLLTFGTIYNYYINVKLKKIFIFGSKLSMFDIFLREETQILAPDSFKTKQCVFPFEYIICKTQDYTITIIKESDFQNVKKIIVSGIQLGFYLTFDKQYNRLFLYKQTVQIYSYSGVYQKTLSQPTTNLIEFNFYANNIVLLTQGNGYIYDRSDCSFKISFLSPMGSVIQKSMYIQSFNNILYFTDNINTGQIYVFSLDLLLDLAPIRNTIFKNYRVVNFSYENEVQDIFFIDVFGNFILYFYGGLANDSPQSIDEFQNSPPLDFSINYLANNVLIYNQKMVYSVNYAILTRTVVRIFQPDHNRYIRLKDSFLIIDSSNIVWKYNRYSISFVKEFFDDIISIRKNNNQIILQFRDYLQVFKDIQNQNNEFEILKSQNYYLIKNIRILFFLKEDIVLSVDQRIIYFDFNNNKINGQILLSQLDEVKVYKFLQSMSLIIIGTAKGIIYSCSTILPNCTIIQTNWNFPITLIVASNQIIWVAYKNGIVFKIIKTSLEIQEPSLDLLKLTGGGYNKELNIFQLDEKYSRIYIQFNFEKRLRILGLVSNTEINGFIGFPNTEQNRMLLTEVYLILYTSSQVNVFSRSNFIFCFTIRNNSRRQQITELQVFEEQYFVLSFLKKIDIYIVSFDSFQVQLIDSIETLFATILVGEIILNKTIFNLIWYSKSNIYEKQYSVLLYTQNLDECSSLIYSSDSFSALKQLSMLQSSFNRADKQVLFLLLNNNFNIINGIDQSKTTLIISPSSQSQRQLDIIPSTFLSIKSSAFIKEFNLNFNYVGQYRFSYSTQSIYLQEIQILNQNIEGIQILFDNKELVVISSLLLSNLKYHKRVLRKTSEQSEGYLSELSSRDISFMNFQNCTKIEIYNLTIKQLQISESSTALIKFNNIENVTFKNIVVSQMCLFYKLIEFKNVRNVNINGLLFEGNIAPFLNLDSPCQLFQLNGCLNTRIINSVINKNIGYQFVKVSRNYQEFEETRILENDYFEIINSTLIENKKQVKVDNSDQTDLHLIDISSSFVRLHSIQMSKNMLNIKIGQAKTIQIIDSNFFSNQSFLGGAIIINQVARSIEFVSTHFIENISLASGGALLFEKVESISFDTKSKIEKNKALIGGGIRIIDNNITIVKGFEVIQTNKADIYGDNIATPVTDMIIESSSFIPENFIFKRKQDNSSFYGDLEMNEYVSGSIREFRLSFLDYSNRKVSFIPQNMKSQLYPKVIMNEIDNFYFLVESQNLDSIEVNGQSLANYNQYDSQQSEFIFSDLVINSIPGTHQYLILKSSTLKVRMSIYFRECQIGEIYKVFSNKIKTCFPCTKGFFSLDIPDSQSTTSQCQKCPYESDQCFENKLILRKGYWRSSNSSSVAIFCENGEEFCDETSQENIQGCILGHIGPLCEQCDNIGNIWGKRYIQNNKGECLICSEPIIQYIFLCVSSFIILIYLIFQIIIFVQSFQYQQTCIFLRKMNMLPISVSQFREYNSFYVKCLMNYIQLQTILAKFQNSYIPKQILLLPNYFGQPSSKLIVDSICLFTPQFIQEFGSGKVKLLMISLIPIIYTAIILLLFFFLRKISKLRPYINIMFRNTAINFLFIFFQPDAINILTKFLTCRNIGNQKYITEDLSYLCNDQSYQKFQRFYALPLLVAWIIFPGFVYFHLYKRRNRLQDCSTMFQYGCYYVELKKSHYYWEFIRIWFRVIIVILFTLFKAHGLIVYLLIFILIAIYQSMLQWQKPYLNQKMMQVEQMSYYTLITIILLKSIKQSASNDLVFDTLNAIMHFLFIIYLLWIIIYNKLFSKRNLIGRIFLFLLKKCVSPKEYQKLTQHSKINFKTYILWKKVQKNIKFITTQKAIVQINKSKQEDSELSLEKECQNIKSIEKLLGPCHNSIGTPKSPQLSRSNMIIQGQDHSYIFENMSPQQFEKGYSKSIDQQYFYKNPSDILDQMNKFMSKETNCEINQNKRRNNKDSIFKSIDQDDQSEEISTFNVEIQEQRDFPQCVIPFNEIITISKMNISQQQY